MTGSLFRPARALTAWLLLSAAAFADGPDLWAIADEGERLRASVEYLSGLGSRISGHEGARRAGDWIERQLAALDLGSVHRETFPITVPVELGGRSRLEVVDTGEEFDMHGLWPNGPRTTTTPPEGLEGQLTWVGNGEYTDFEGRQLHGRVVLMEFNTWDRWVRLAALGARAVIFIEPAETSYPQTEDKSLIVPVDVPRFWVGAEAGRQLRRRLEGGAEIGVRLHSRMDWIERPCANLWVEITGADTALARQRIVVQSYYDGTSIAPSLAPSAEASSGAAAMLELARHLRDHRPARTVVLLLTGSHFQDQAGIVDFVESHTRKSDFHAPFTDSMAVDLYLGLDLSTKTDQVAIWNNTTSFDLKRFYVPFGRRYTRYAEETAAELGRRGEPLLLNGISPIRGMDWSTFVPDGAIVDTRMAMLAGQVALSFVTAHDARFPLATPLDTPGRMNLDNLRSQSRFLKGVLSRSFDDPDLFTGLEDFGPVLKDQLRSHTVRVRAFPRRSQIPDRPVADALVMVGWGMHKGLNMSRAYLTDELGDVTVSGLVVGATTVVAYVLDRETGEVVYAPDLSERGQKHHGKPLASGRMNWSIRWNKDSKPLVVFPSMQRTLFGLTHPNQLVGLSTLTMLGSGGIAPRQFGYAFGRTLSSNLCVVFAPQEAAVEDPRVKMLFGDMLLINSPGGTSEQEAKGAGYDLAVDDLLPSELFALRDTWRLNEARLATMRSHAIENQRITRLHEAGRRFLARAEDSLREGRWRDYVAEVRSGLGVTLKAYPQVKATLNDVIKGIVFFLALVVPTAFFGERLLFAASDIRWQIGGFSVLLLIVWILISQVHPAFDIAHPLIILLAFFIMAMAVFVLGMVSSRFNRFIKEYQAERAKVHETDISRVSAAYAAFMLGISNMRRRRLRTGLTLLTLTLLTFTVLSFTSVRPEVWYFVFPLRHEGAYTGALIRDRGWSSLPETTLEYARSHFEEHGLVVPRNWYITYDDEEKKYTEIRRDGRMVRATGLLGLTSEEQRVTGLASTLAAGSWFEGGGESTCLISEGMAEGLGIDPGEVGRAEVQVFGKRLTVAGIFSADAFDEVRDLDDEPLSPADFQLSSMQALGPMEGPQMTVQEEEEAQEVRPFVHLDPANVLILPYETLKVAFGDLRSVAIRFDEGAPAQELIEEFLQRISGTVFAGLPDEEGRIRVVSYTSLGGTSVEGLAALTVPMLIAALIVLNTMMGAVYERFREIGIYSSVGLAPMHIALLFIAEACVYAVMGVTLGYLIGQILGRGLVHFDLLGGMNLNYSSFAAILAACMVMGVVLLSTIYPARVASRSAVPDTVRRWRPPPPDGDRWEFDFPFMVGQSEVVGICGFLANFFSAYSEESIGDFYADKVRITTEETPAGREYAVQLLLWLAPFDMGVSQFLQIELAPTSTPGVFDVQIYIHRVSGQDTYWQRVNRRFVNHLRKEFLIWHTLDAESKAFHDQSARDRIAAEAAAEVEAAT